MLLSVWFYMAGVRIASDWRRHFSRFHIFLVRVGDNFIVQYFNCSCMIGVAISRFKIDSMLSTKGSNAPGSFMESRL